jgi:hypothetical protein
MSTLKWIGFKNNKSDPCLLSKWAQCGVIIIGIHLDDCLFIGKLDRIAKLIVELKKSGFNLKVENSVTNYLGCELIENAELKEILIFQPHLINKLEANYREEVKVKRFINLAEHQDLKLLSMKMIMTSLNQICIVDTVLE